jgi:hypothetical protein
VVPTFESQFGHLLPVKGIRQESALATSLDLPLLFKGDDFRRTDVRPALPAG